MDCRLLRSARHLGQRLARQHLPEQQRLREQQLDRQLVQLRRSLLELRQLLGFLERRPGPRPEPMLQ